MVPLEIARATELADFRQCRRRWSWDREKRHPARTIPTALVYGSIIHRALECYHGNGRQTADLMTGLTLGADEQIAELLEQGFCDEAVIPALNEMYPQAAEMVAQYAEYDHEVTVPAWDVVDTERRHTVSLSPDLPSFSGQIDLLVRIDGRLWVCDHKTRSRLPDKRQVHLDSQMTSYCYLVKEVYGEMPAGAIYNVLVKKKPSVTVRAPKAGVSPWQGRFARIMTERSEEAIAGFAWRTAVQLREMVEVAAQTERAYPSPGFLCPTCQYARICLADLSGATGDGEMMPWEDQR